MKNLRPRRPCVRRCRWGSASGIDHFQNSSTVSSCLVNASRHRAWWIRALFAETPVAHQSRNTFPKRPVRLLGVQLVKLPRWLHCEVAARPESSFSVLIDGANSFRLGWAIAVHYIYKFDTCYFSFEIYFRLFLASGFTYCSRRINSTKYVSGGRPVSLMAKFPSYVMISLFHAWHGQWRRYIALHHAVH